MKQTAIRKFVKGAPLDPLDQRTRRAITVIPLLAWVGLGADSLSSSCYGPEQAFLALGPDTHLGLYFARAMASTSSHLGASHRGEPHALCIEELTDTNATICHGGETNKS